MLSLLRKRSAVLVKRQSKRLICTSQKPVRRHVSCGLSPFMVKRRYANTDAAKSVFEMKAQIETPMLCMQCEQTAHGQGCTQQGICGKIPEVSNLQDMLIWSNGALIEYVNKVIGGEVKLSENVREDFRDHVLNSMFSTLTNVNFDDTRMIDYLRKSDSFLKNFKNITKSKPAKMDFSLEAVSDEQLINDSKEYGPQKRRYEFRDVDCFGLHECSLYGLKGTMAYFAHAEHIRRDNKSIYSEEERNEVFKQLYAVYEGLNNNKQELGDYLKLALNVGAVNIKVLELLDRCHNKMFGVPEPTMVSASPVPGKCILMSGHDIIDVWRMLEATKDKGINVYTHGELLPSHAYPELKKYKNFIGHFGSAWQNQVKEFKEFPGSIVMTTNCLMPPRRRYKDRLFTINAVGYEGIPHVDITNPKDLSTVIDKALSLEGFNEGNMEAWKEAKPHLTGFGHQALLSNAETIVKAIKAGALTDIFVIGGCDGTEKSRSYFSDLAKLTPQSSVILTLGCGKFRLRHLELGNFANTPIPRIIDCGQCNDAYSAVVVALKLAEALNTDLHKLPLHFAVSWFEQKAVAVLLSLLHLGVKNIRLGPTLPAFLTPNVQKYLVDNLNLRPATMGHEKQDMEQMLAQK